MTRIKTATKTAKPKAPKKNGHEFEPAQDDIRLGSYLIWEREGKPCGKEAEHWQRARAELIARHKAETAAKPPKTAARDAPAAKVETASADISRPSAKTMKSVSTTKPSKIGRRRTVSTTKKTAI